MSLRNKLEKFYVRAKDASSVALRELFERFPRLDPNSKQSKATRSACRD
jgi:hypothetical protein